MINCLCYNEKLAKSITFEVMTVVHQQGFSVLLYE